MPSDIPLTTSSAPLAPVDRGSGEAPPATWPIHRCPSLRGGWPSSRTKERRATPSHLKVIAKSSSKPAWMSVRSAALSRRHRPQSARIDDPKAGKEGLQVQQAHLIVLGFQRRPGLWLGGLICRPGCETQWGVSSGVQRNERAFDATPPTALWRQEIELRILRYGPQVRRKGGVNNVVPKKPTGCLAPASSPAPPPHSGGNTVVFGSIDIAHSNVQGLYTRPTSATEGVVRRGVGRGQGAFHTHVLTTSSSRCSGDLRTLRTGYI